MKLYFGITESRDDPQKLGRVKVRISGVHTDNKVILPTSDLPWATPIQSVTSAALSGIGHSATGILEGTMVACTFTDENMQIPLILGTIAGIPTADATVSVLESFVDSIDEESTSSFIVGANVGDYLPPSITNVESNQGFKDPNGKYPLPALLEKPDTPLLSSGLMIQTNTIVGPKFQTRTQNVTVANSTIKWSQSSPPYNARYPYNHSYRSESGHVMEFDDTPGSERINIHHKDGTFIEIDDAGNQTNKVNGIRTIIVEEEDLINIKGSGHVNIVGDNSVRIGGQCQVEIVGDATMLYKGNLTQKVTGDYNLIVSGKFKASVEQDASFSAATSLNLKSGTYTNIKGGVLNLQANTFVNMLGGSTLNLDGSAIYLNSGRATGASEPIPPTQPVAYSPTIRMPSPTTYEDSAAFDAEDIYEHEQDTIVPGSYTPTPITITPVAPITLNPPLIGPCDFVNLSLNTQMSPIFKLGDLCLEGGYFPWNGNAGLSAAQVACNAKQLCANVLDILFARYAADGIKINSCIRAHKAAAQTISQHEKGMAVDIGFTAYSGANRRFHYHRIACEIMTLIRYDQIILEYADPNSVWIHISYDPQPTRPSRAFTLNNHHTWAGRPDTGLILL